MSIKSNHTKQHLKQNTKQVPKTNRADEKLQKVIARAGFCSRREAERWIQDGRISVNGKLASLGDRVKQEDKIRVDGVIIHDDAIKKTKVRIIMYNKPEGEVCTRKDPENRATVFESLPTIYNSRWVQVGRLDTNTSGLLLFTNDGELANLLMHPSSEIEREYAVRVFGEVTDEMKKRLRKGVELDDGMASFHKIVDAGGEGMNHWYHVSLSEGRNREVRRLWESQSGIKVSRLIRLRYGVCNLDRELPRGRWKYLTGTEIKAIMKSVGYSAEIAEDKNSPGKRTIKSRYVSEDAKAKGTRSAKNSNHHHSDQKHKQASKNRRGRTR